MERLFLCFVTNEKSVLKINYQNALQNEGCTWRTILNSFILNGTLSI